MVELVLCFAQEDSSLGWKCISNAQDGKEELCEDQQEAGKESNLDTGHVPLELHEDQADEQSGCDGLHSSHDGQSLVALHVHHLAESGYI